MNKTSQGGATLVREMSVGQVARRTGVAVSALHFYERKGLINSRRNAGGQRRFSRDVLRRVAIIRAARRLGISLSEIADALARLPSHRTPTAKDWRYLADRWRTRLSRQIDQLLILRDQLDGCIGCGCLSLEECPLRNPDDIAAADGPGARLFDEPR